MLSSVRSLLLVRLQNVSVPAYKSIPALGFNTQLDLVLELDLPACSARSMLADLVAFAY